MNESELSIKDIILEHNYPAKSYTLTFDGQGKIALRSDLGWLAKASFEISNEMNDRSYLIKDIANYIENAVYAPGINNAENDAALRYVNDEVENLNFEKAVEFLFTELTSLISNGVSSYHQVKLAIGEAIWMLDSSSVEGANGYHNPVCFDRGVASLSVHFNQKISMIETIQPVSKLELMDPDLMEHLSSQDFEKTYPKGNLVTVIRTADDFNSLDQLELGDKLHRYYPKQNFIIVNVNTPLKGGLDHDDEEAMAALIMENFYNYARLESLSL